MIRCTDPDNAGGVSYHFMGMSPTGMFTINENTGIITRTQNISSTNTFVYDIQCSDFENLNTTSVVAITIYIPNLNPPSFSMFSYEFSIDEGLSASPVGMVSATDPDGNDVTYMLEGADTAFFRISSSSGLILSIIPFDRETRDSYTLTVFAYDNVAEMDRRSSTATVNVVIDDVNDNRPVFSSGSVSTVIINQNLPTNGVVTVVSCNDADTGANAHVIYALLVDSNGMFSIGATTGNITFISGLLSPGAEFSIVVQCTDGVGGEVRSLTIAVEEENQHDPMLEHAMFLTVSIDETVPTGYRVIDINATDEDEGEPGRIIYSLERNFDVFGINSMNGIVEVSAPLDYESDGGMMYTLQVVAANPQLPGSMNRSVSAIVQVTINNINDHPPQFPGDYMMSVQETYVNEENNMYIIPPPHNFMNISCTDRDIGTQTITYSLDSNAFVIDPILGNISAIQNLDFETTTSYSLQAYCYDNSLPNGNNLTGTTLIEITVLPVNEHRPVIEHQVTFVSIDETTEISTIIVSFDPDSEGLLNYMATDADSGADGDIFYFVGEDTELGLFSVDQERGIYRLASSLDADNAETAISFTRLHVVACDSQAVQRDCIIVVVRIIISAVNEHVPMFTEDPYTFLVNESVSNSTTVPVFNTLCIDGDEMVRHGRTTVTVRSGGNNVFRVDDNGNFFLLLPLDYENNMNYGYELECTDGEFTNTTMVNITVLPVNDNIPRFIGSPFSFNVSVSTPVLSRIGQVTAFDGDIDEGGLLAYILQTNGYFSIVQDGYITLLTELDNPGSTTPPPNFLLRVDLTDGMTNLATNVSIILTDGNYVAPVFGQYLFISTVDELAEMGTLIQVLTCHDTETGVNGKIEYRVSLGNTERLFDIDPDSGALTVAGSLVLPENEDTVDHILIIQCRDGGVPVLSATAQLIVRIEANMGLPNVSNRTAFVLENAQLNDQVVCIDTDSDNNQLTYEITSGNDEMKFAVTSAGCIIVSDLLDRETTSEYHLQVQVSDVSNTGSVFSNVRIFVRDVNDNDPQCSFISEILRVEEQRPVNSELITLNCSDIDSQNNAILSYTLDESTFNITSSGQLILNEPLNFMQQSVYSLRINVSDNGGINARSILVTIVVFVIPSNTNPPTFQNLPASIDINETTPVQEVIYTVQATDPEGGRVIFRMADGDNDLFLMIPNTGAIILLRRLDFHTAQSHVITIVVSDTDLESDPANLTINVLDVNEFSPSCSQQRYFVNIAENISPDMLLDVLSCSDSDRGENGELTYSISTNNFFGVTSDGLLSVLTSLDYETQQQYELTVNISDNGTSPKLASAILVISVLPVNEHDPVFSQTEYQVCINESLTVGSIVTRVFANDMDLSSHRDGQISYTLTDGDDIPFSIDGNGVIRLTGTLDSESEQNSTFIISVVATDGGTSPRSSNGTVNVTVKDVNDNTPSFAQGLYIASINSSLATGDMVLPSLNCTDQDSGLNGNVTYRLLDDTLTLFSIHESSGIVRVREMLPEVSQVFGFDVVCADMGSPSLSATVHVSIVVTIPGSVVFSPSTYRVSILENVTFTEVERVSASSSTGNIIYSLLNHQDTFAIDGNTGAITLLSSLDFEMVESYAINVRATTGTQFADALVQVDVVNINDETPVFVERMFSVRILENTNNLSNPVTVNCTDNDSGGFGEIQYSVNNDNFAVTDNGNLRVLNSLDYEMVEALILTVTCMDGGTPPKSDSIAIVVTVLPVNEYPPDFSPATASVSINENVGIATLIYTANATDRDSQPHENVRYSIIGGNEANIFSIDSETGLVTAIGQLDYEQQISDNSIVLTIQASDEDSNVVPPFTPMSSTLTLTIMVLDVNDNEPRFTESVYSDAFTSPVTANTPLLMVSCSDTDSGSNAAITYSINPENNLFQISDLGTIMNTAEINLLSGMAFILNVRCSDGALIDTSRAIITVSVDMVGPVFNDSNYMFRLSENSSIGYQVGRVLAHNFDPQNQDSIEYFSNNTNFIVDRTTGVITLATTLDYETLSPQTDFTITIYATDSAGLTTSEIVIIILDNLNENGPVIDASNRVVAILENEQIGTMISSVTCQDSDDAADNLLPTLSVVTILANTPIGFTSQNPASIELTTNSQLDYEMETQYLIMLQCRDSGGLISTANIRVVIEPFNDNPPIFSPAQYNTSLFENPSIGSPIFTITASDNDLGNYNQIQYTINSGNTGDAFSIDSTSGIITVSGLIDSETLASYELVIQATNIIPAGDQSGSQPLSATAQLHIEIDDLNDNRPSLSPLTVIRSIVENTPVPITVQHFQCTDRDSGQNSEIALSVTTGNSLFYFNDNGNLLFNGTSTIGTYSAMVTCSDMGMPQQSSVAQVRLIILSENQHPPILPVSQYNITISEDQPVGECFYYIVATDADGNETADGQIRYTITSQNNLEDVISIDTITGCLFLVTTVDIQTVTIYSYTVTATDGGSPSQSNTAALRLTINTAGNSLPQFTQGHYVTAVSETFRSGEVIFTEISCTDPDPFDTIQYTILPSGSHELFSIHPTTGHLSIANGTTLDFEVTDTHSLLVACMDTQNASATADLTVRVNPVNEFTPGLSTTTTTVPETAYIGFLVAILSSIDQDSGLDGEVRYDIADNNNVFALDPMTGRVILSSSLDYESGPRSYNLTVTAADLSETFPRTGTALLLVSVEDINDNAPSFGSDMYKQNLSASSSLNSVVLSINCTDNDDGQNEGITYDILPNPPSTDLFSIDTNNGMITVSANLANRQVDNATFFITCRDNVHPVLSDTTLVAICIQEQNQHSPVFANNSYTMTIPETRQLLQPLLTVTATDDDTGPFGRITYSIESDPDQLFFTNSTTGTIMLLKQLDYESQLSHSFTVVATDGLSDSINRRSASAMVTINVGSVNEYTPRCPRPIYIGIIANQFDGEILNFSCVDRDNGLDGTLTYTITGGSHSSNFSIQGSTLILEAPIAPDDAEERYSLNVTVSDMGDPPLQVVVDVEILYSFENLASPMFVGTPYMCNVLECANIGTMVCNVMATDTDRGIQGEVTYSLTGTSSSFFRIDPTDGIIYLASTLDRETLETLTFQVLANDQDPNNPMNTTALVTIEVLDCNDNCPICSLDFYEFLIYSNSSDNSPVGSINCSDDDTGNNGMLQYTITEPPNTFSITNNGDLILRRRSDLNPSSSILIEILVSDRGTPNCSVSILTSVRVVFGNAMSPQFNNMPYVASVHEDTRLLDAIFQLQASDGDSSDLTYRLVRDISNTFYVNPNTGEVVLVRPLDYETRQSYSIDVAVMDSGSYDGTNILTVNTTVQIDIQNVNDNTPTFDSGVYGTIIPQSQPVGSRIINGTCNDNDLGTFGDVTVTWDGISSPFQLVVDSGNFSIRVMRSLAPGSHTINLTCTDGGNVSSSAMLFISVRASPDPEFTNTRYEWLLQESVNISAAYTNIMATSPGNDYPMVYSFVDDSEHFSINSATGVVSLAQTLDYEMQTQFGLIVRATDAVNRFTDVLLLVRVLDVNDELPLVPPSAILSINHSHPVGAPFAFLTCSDRDVIDADARFNFTFDPPSQIFFVDDVGIVYLVGQLDLTPVYALPVICFDVNTPEMRSFGVVTINVIFNNLYQPSFEFQNYHTSISERASIGDVVLQVTATDRDVGIFGQVSYSILDGNYNNHFFINGSSGEIKILLDLDREQTSMFNLTIAAIDGGLTTSDNSRQTGTALVQVFVSDYNDNPPTFDQSLYRLNITTVTLRNTLIGNIVCSDRDEGRSMEISYSLRPEDIYYFSINGTGGVFLVNEHSFPAPYTLTVVCTDNGSPQLSSTAILSIIVRLEDPTAPVFNQSVVEITVNENIALFTLITSLSATSNDSTLQVRYNILSGNTDNTFGIDGVTGELYNIRLLDAELVSEYSITVEASYTEYLTAVSYAVVTVRVTDINDNAPYFVPSPLYSTMISEAVGMQEVLIVSCTDNDTITDITYSIADGNSDQMFEINSAGVIFSTRGFDYELRSSYTLTIICSDGGMTPRTATAQAIVAIIPENDHIPNFSVAKYNLTVSENAELGTSVGDVSATDSDQGPHGHVTYRIVTAPPFNAFFIHPITGIIQVSGTLDYESIRIYEMSTIATDGYVESSVPLCVTILDVNDNAPEISPQISIREIEHNTTANTVVSHFDCSDADSSSSQEMLTMNITSGNDMGWFLLTSDGDIVWMGAVNIASVIINTIEIRCYDGGRMSDPAHFTSVVYPAGRSIPRFMPSHTYLFAIDEHSTIDTSVGTIMTDSTVNFSILNPINNLPFGIDSTTGEIQVTLDIDYESQQSYNFVIIANNTADSSSNAAAVRVVVNDVNDNPPMFSQDVYSISLPENLQFPSYVATIMCTDIDADDDIEITAIVQGNTNNPFKISGDGILSVVLSLDFETMAIYNLQLLCSDSIRNDISTVNITVIPVNEHPPVFINTSYMRTVMESNMTGRHIITVTANDTDRSNGANVMYSIANSIAAGKFEINTTSGVIRNSQPLLVVDQTHYALEVLATDGGLPNTFTSTALVVVEVTDINERPMLILGTTEVVASTATPPETILLTFQCVDNDIGQNSRLQLSHQITPNLGVNVRTLTSDYGIIIGQLYVNMTLLSNDYNLTITCTDGGSPPLPQSENVSLRVLDANAEGPEFLNSSYVVSIYENVTINTLLITVYATDPNGVRYEIVDGNYEDIFYIIPTNGSVFIQRAVDADSGPSSYNLTILATDLAPALPLTATTIVNVLIININDHNPEINPSESALLNVLETTSVGTRIKEYSCSDTDGHTTSLGIARDGNIGTAFNTIADSESDIFHVTLRTALDYERETAYTLTILCTDEVTAISPSRTASATLIIVVNPINIYAPEFTNETYKFYISERSLPGTSVGTVSATDTDNRMMSAIRYSLISFSPSLGAFAISSSTGNIITTAAFNDSVSNYNVTVEASDGDLVAGPRSTRILVMVCVSGINDNRPVCLDQTIRVTLNETTFAVNTSVANITCSDQDSGQDGLLTYSFISTDINGFAIRTVNNMIGEVLVFGTVEPRVYILVVNVSDRGTPTLSEVVHVIINIQRAPDNRLQFSDLFFSTNVSENTLTSTVIFRGSNFMSRLVNIDGAVEYSMVVSTEIQSLFSINRFSGDITLLQPLDYETTMIYVISIDAEDDSGTQAHASLTVMVINYNDEMPEFSMNEYYANVTENQNSGTSVLQIVATDIDFGPVSYHLSTDSTEFIIDQSTGRITTLRPLDKELTPFTLTVQVNATDSGNPQLFSIVNAFITVLDLNDNAPVFNQTEYLVNITNLSPAGRLVALSAYDLDSSSELRFSIDDDSGLFLIDPVSGVLQLRATVPPSHQQFYAFTAFVTDGLNTTNTSVLVQVFDVTAIELNFPETPTVERYSYNITEFLVNSGFSVSIDAQYTILSGNTGDNFQITTGILTNRNELDRETISRYEIIVVVNSTDSQINVALIITISDINDNEPIFSQLLYEFSIVESHYISPNTLGQIQATDRDAGINSRISFQIVSDEEVPFIIRATIAGNEVDFSAIGGIDRENIADYNLTIIARDFAPINTLTSTAIVLVDVVDVNDNAPKFSSIAPPTTVVETPPGSTILTITATDSDEGRNGEIAFLMNAVNNGDDVTGSYHLENVTNGVARLITDRTIGLNSDGTEFRITAIDGGPVSHYPTDVTVQTITFSLSVGNSNPQFTSLVYTGQVLQWSEPDPEDVVLQVVAFDKDFGNSGQIKYRLSGEVGQVSSETHPFIIDPDTGYIYRGRRISDPPSTRYQFYVEVLDNAPGQPGMDTAFVIIDVFISSNVLNVYTCKTAEFVRNNSNQFRQGIEVLVKQQSDRGSLFVYDISDVSSMQRVDTM